MYYSRTNRSGIYDIKTLCGTIRGIQSNGINQYLGIPYAVPPINSLRFQKPIAIDSEILCKQAWKTEEIDDNIVLFASNYRNSCTQLIPITDEVVGTEDCLYLNVFSPPSAHISNLKPVVVIIGGLFFLYDGVNKFMNHGLQPESKTVLDVDAIHVTFNYRLGPLGFLTHPSIGISNIGLFDQIAALRWVRSNIRFFGGDPVKITIFSYGSGATSTLGLLSTPSAQHLFDRAWLSAPALLPPTVSLKSAIKSSRNFFNYDNNITAGRLYELSNAQITLFWNWSSVEPWLRSNIFSPPSTLPQACLPGLPCTGGFLVQDNELITEKSFRRPINNITVVFGQNSNEAGTYITPESVRYWTSDTLMAYLKTIFGSSTPTFQRIIKMYEISQNSEEIVLSINNIEFSFIEDILSRIITDIRVTCPMNRLLNNLTQHLSIFRYYIENRHVYFDPYGFEYFVSSAFHGWDAFLYLRSYQYHSDFIYSSLSHKSTNMKNVKNLSEMLVSVMKMFVHDGYISNWKFYKDNSINYYNNTFFSIIPSHNFSFCSFWNEIKNDAIFQYTWKA